MAAATVTTKVYEKNVPAQPGVEVVVITVSDGETYTAKTLSAVDAVVATWNEDMGATDYTISCAISGAVVTVHAEGVTDKKCCLVLYGRP